MKLLKKLLIIIPVVVGLILVGIFMPAQQVSIEGIGRLSVGSEVAYAHPAAPTYQEFTEASSSSDVTSITVDKPAGTASGDLLIGVVATDGDAGTFTPPSGWTLINSGTADPGGDADQVTVGTWYKIAGGSEPASYTWNWTTAQAVYAFIVRITGHDSSNPINVFGVATGSSTGTSITITSPDVTTSVDDTLVLRIFGADRAMNFGSYPSGHTGITFGSSSGDNTTMYQCTSGTAWQTQATAGATGTADFTAIPNLSATEEWRALTVAIAPAAAAQTYQSFTEAKSGPESGPPNNVTSITVDKPAGTASGDLLIGVVATDGNAGTFTPPAGWTLIDSGLSGTGDTTWVTLGTWYKIAGGSEPASYTWNWTTAQTVYAFIVRVTGHDSSNPINVSGVATGTSITPTCPDVNTTVADTLVLRIFGANWAQVTVDGGYPSGHTGITVDVSGDPAQPGQCSGGAAYIAQAAIGATGTAAFTMTGAHEWRALTVAIAPAAAAPDISNAPPDEDFGTVQPDQTYSTPTGYFNVDNNSSMVTNISISVTTSTWPGGIAWNHNDSGSPGPNAAALRASKNTGAFDVIVKYNTPYDNIASNQPANTDFQWELQLLTPTTFSDGVQKSIIVRLTATAA